MHAENDNTPPAAPLKKESFLDRMQRRGRLVVQPKRPGELDVLAKLREAAEHVPETKSTTGENEQ